MKKKTFLITTAIDNKYSLLLNKKKFNKFYLGKFCISDDLEFKEFNKTNCLNSYWKYRNKNILEYKYLKKVTLSLFKVIAKKLNKIHKVKENKKYWKIILYPWVCYYVTTSYDRWKIISNFQKLKKKNKFFVYKYNLQNDYLKILNLVDWHNKISLDPLNNFLFIEIIKFKNLKNIEIIKKKKIRIGYFSSDFHNNATSHLITRILELHDKKKFEIYGFYLSNKKDDMHERIKKSFDKFFYCGNDTNKKIVYLARQSQIDIAVDLKGYINNNKFSIFENKCAPIQINYLGYPGTTGSLNMDYIIADRNLISKSEEKYYTEKIIYLPNSYQPNDNTKITPFKKLLKSDFNLPENKIILCSFNNTYKITQEIFDIWIRILQKNPNTVLWLLSNSEIFEKNILNYACSRNIDSSRIIYAKPTNNIDHMERLRLADLFLDSYPCCGHTTASDALWVGLPLITIKGKTFASRVASSLLNNIGLNEMITTSLDEYYYLACDLISNEDRLSSIKNKLKENKLKKSLFNSEEYARDLERAYIEVYENKLKKLPNKNIYL